MAFLHPTQLRTVRGLNPNDMLPIHTYLQGAVYAWVRDRRAQVFALRDLVGGANFDWNGTPLSALYEKHIRLGKDEDQAIKAAGRDAGWILKSVLKSDLRVFDRLQVGRSVGYRWI
jgi:hypothetical protein